MNDNKTFYVNFKDDDEPREVDGITVDHYLSLCDRTTLMSIESISIPVVTVEVLDFNIDGLVKEHLVKYWN